MVGIENEGETATDRAARLEARTAAQLAAERAEALAAADRAEEELATARVAEEQRQRILDEMQQDPHPFNPEPLEPEHNNPNAQAANSLKMHALFLALGLKVRAAQYFVEDQDIDTLEKLALLDDEDIKNLCYNARKTGGVPKADGTARGTQLAVIHERHFKLASFYVKYLQMTGRPLAFESVTVEAVESIMAFRKEIKNSENPDIEEAPKLVHDKLFQFFDAFKEYLNECIGTVSGRPLAYVVRKHMNILPSNIDPAYGKPGSTYNSYVHEIENRAPILMTNPDGTLQEGAARTHHYLHDNAQVWKILYAILKGTTYVTYIKQYLKKQDGRSAYEALYSKLLGSQAISNYASMAENKLDTMTLSGNRKNWNLDKYTLAHIEQHNILTKLKEHGHTGIDENSKKRKYIRGIVDPALSAVAASLAVNEPATFDEMVMAFKTFKQSEKENVRKQPLHVASMSSTTGNRVSNKKKRPTEDGDGFDPNKDYTKFKVAKRYYKPDEWNALTKGQRNYLRTLRTTRKKKGTSNHNDKRTIAELTARIMALEADTKAIGSDVPEDQSDSDVELVIPKKKRKTTRVPTLRK